MWINRGGRLAGLARLGGIAAPPRLIYKTEFRIISHASDTDLLESERVDSNIASMRSILVVALSADVCVVAPKPCGSDETVFFKVIVGWSETLGVNKGQSRTGQTRGLYETYSKIPN